MATITMVDLELLERVRPVLEQEPRMLRVNADQSDRVVFVGDTHGDLDASERVIAQYFDDRSTVVFLGDYVDRGPQSRENLEYLLRLKVEHPDRLYLLQGNHEGMKEQPFGPADFWDALDRSQHRLCADVLAELPWAVALPNGVMGVHAALPSVDSLEAIDDVASGSLEWRQLVWGDWQDQPGEFLGDMGSRPQFGRDFFERQMETLGQSVLIRSHQPHVPQWMMDDRCLTIFTSHAYGPRERTVAIVDLHRAIESGDAITLETV